MNAETLAILKTRPRADWDAVMAVDEIVTGFGGGLHLCHDRHKTWLSTTWTLNADGFIMLCDRGLWAMRPAPKHSGYDTDLLDTSGIPLTPANVERVCRFAMGESK